MSAPVKSLMLPRAHTELIDRPTSAMDPLLYLLFGYVLVTVWRVQDLYPILGTLRVP